MKGSFILILVVLNFVLNILPNANTIGGKIISIIVGVLSMFAAVCSWNHVDIIKSNNAKLEKELEELKKEFYEFTLALDALKKSLTGDQKTVILDADSELAKILTGN